MYICSFYQKQNCACNTNNVSIPSFGSSFSLGQILKAINEQDKSFFNKECDDNGNTILHYLASMNNTSAIKHLGKLAFLNDIINKKNRTGKTPLDVAIKDNVKEILISIGAKTSSQIAPESSEKAIDLGKQPVFVDLVTKKIK